MQNLLFVVFRLYGGGAERVVSNLTMEFGDRYHIKIAIYDGLEKTYPHKGELIKIKLPFSDDPTANAWWKRPLRLLVLIYKLRQLKRKHKIDVAISFGEQPNIINILTRGNRRTILSVRSLLSKEMELYPKMRVLKYFIKLFYNRAHQVIVPSRLSALDLSTHFGIKQEKLRVIYNFIDPGKVLTMAAESLDDPFLDKLFQQPVLLNVGRITAAKGQWLLFRALKKLNNPVRNFRLAIVGEADTEGNLKQQLLQLAAELGLKVYDASGVSEKSLDFDIYLLGFMTNPFKFMKRSEMLVFPSVFEGFPNSLLEAMQCGLPVIAADCIPAGRSCHLLQIFWKELVRQKSQTMEYYAPRSQTAIPKKRYL